MKIYFLSDIRKLPTLSFYSHFMGLENRLCASAIVSSSCRVKGDYPFMNYNAGTEGAQRVEAYMIFHSLMFFGATVLRNGTRYLVVFHP